MLLTGPARGASVLVGVPVNGVQVAHVTDTAPFVVFKYDMTRVRCVYKKKEHKIRRKKKIN
jgi:hypothetical protein